VKPHVEISRSSQACGRCSGTGCGKCGGTGEEAAPPTVVSITCICGNYICGGDWEGLATAGDRCPECGEELRDAVEAALAEPDGEPWDRADLDLEGFAGP